MAMKSSRIIILLAVLLLPAVYFLGFWEGEGGRGDGGPLVVGVLHPTKVDITTFNGFKSKIAELGYQEGKDIIYMYDGPAGRGEGLKTAAGKMVAAGVDLIFASSTPATKAAKAATESNKIPVVFAPVNDPIAADVVRSLKKPGDNITGVTLPASGGKRLRWIDDIKPGTKNVLFLLNPKSKSSQASLLQAKEGAMGTGITITVRDAGTPEDIDALLENLPEDTDAIFLPRDAFINGQIEKISAAAISRGLPLSSPGLIQVEAGALFSYGFEHFAVGSHAAEIANKIFLGASPGETPVETARSHLFINMATAKAIGLDIPESVLQQTRKIIR